MKNLYNFNYQQIQDEMLNLNMKAYRGKQIFRWLYRGMATSIDDMSDISKDARAQLKESYTIETLETIKIQVSNDGTRKYLFKLADGCLVESVLMRFDYGNSVCVSSQVGCNMGCRFCASGLLKKNRDLSSAEMVQQVMAVQADIKDQRVSHVVVMGTGEPFDNYNNVMNFLNIINDDNGMAIGARHITISTCGIVPKIIEFAQGKYQYNLAISLHAAYDELRTRLMPINNAYPLRELMRALDVYESLNNRRLTFEYILLKDVNDSRRDAEKLAKLLRNKNYYINLIPYNSVDEKDFRNVSKSEALIFYDILCKMNVRCTIRKEHGADIDAACGQLRAKELLNKRGE